VTRGFTATRLAWRDVPLGRVEVPKGRMALIAGFGSGLATRPGGPPGVVWAVGDRGPNIDVETAAERFGLEALGRMHAHDGAKLMPRPDAGPALAELRVEGDAVRLVRTIRIADASGRPISGLPVPGGPHAASEPAIDLAGERLEPDPSGADTEGIVALSDGGFWVGDEYGPSLLRLDAGGRVVVRWVPKGTEGQYARAGYPVEGRLPAIAARRRLNRGFEALAASPDERWLYLAFQSPLAHPDKAAHEGGRHVRLWKLDAATGAVAAQFLYPLDPPESFARDRAEGEVEPRDLKVSEIAALGPDRLLVLERASATTRLYAVDLDPAAALHPAHLDPATRPTAEELSGAGVALPALSKRRLLDTDDAPEIDRDLEGVALLSAHELLIVNDNDFGVEGASTAFWRIRFDAPLDRPS